MAANICTVEYREVKWFLFHHNSKVNEIKIVFIHLFVKKNEYIIDDVVII